MSIVQRLHPGPSQEAGLRQHCGHARWVWNSALNAVRARALSLSELDRYLASARSIFPWLAEGSSSVQQGATRDLRQAYANRGKNRSHFRLPTHRKRGIHESFRVRDLRVRKLNRKWAQVLIPKVGWVKFRLTRPFDQIAAASSARVRLHPSGEWSIAFVCPPPAFERKSTGEEVGIDLGIAATVVTSDAEFLRIPVPSAAETSHLRRLQQRLSRQQRGSNRRRLSKRKIAKLSARARRRRMEFVEQISTKLVRQYDFIALEDLRITNMVSRPAPKPDPDQPGAFLPNGAAAKAGLNRSIHAAAWGALRERIQAKAALATSPVEVVLVNPAFTSQQCAPCGHISPENRESQAIFSCKGCGHTAHADVNASCNILHRGRTGRQRTRKPGRSSQQRQPKVAQKH